MTVVAVDLALKLGAWVVMNDQRQVLYTGDSWNKPQTQVVAEISDLCLWPDLDVLILEDIPFRIHTKLTKAVFRLQGRIIDRVCELGQQDKLLFLPPAAWQRHFPGVWKGGPEGAKKAALSYNFLAPDYLSLRAHLIPPLGDPARAKFRPAQRKIATDVTDAFLIATWAYETKEVLGHFDVPTSSRYTD